MDNEEENQKTDEIIIPYFAIRIINDESLNPDVVNKFIEEFLIEYINNLDIRNQSEGIFITFTNEDYIFSENFNDAINSNDGKKFVVKIEEIPEEIEYNCEIKSEYRPKALSERKLYEKNGLSYYDKSEDREDDNYDDPEYGEMRKHKHKVEYNKNFEVKCSISASKTKFDKNSVQETFVYDTASANIHMPGGKFFDPRQNKFILTDIATIKEIEQFKDEFPLWNKRIIAT